MTNISSQVELIKKNIKSYPDFPKSGILFQDVFAVLKNPESAEALKNLIIAHCTPLIPKIQAVVALESRGFLFGPIIALHFKIPLIPIRKKGKLPGKVNSISYALEYGSATFEVQNCALPPGSNVLIVDDLLATGGSLAAACKLIHSIGCKVEQCLVVIELEDLKGKKNVPSAVHSLIKL